MSKKYIYMRVSTEHQDFDQQMQDIVKYGVDPTRVDGITKEHVSGGKSYCDREFMALLKKCEPGDTIYAASTDRLGRNFVDMVNLMKDAKNKGVTIIACKQDLSLSDDNISTKLLLAITAIIDEDERMRIRHRTLNAVRVAIAQIEKDGARMTKNGQIQTKWGREKGCDMSAAYTVSAEEKRQKAADWRNKSRAYAWVKIQVAKGKTRAAIIEEFNELHKQAPDIYCTREGKPLSKGVLSKWCSEFSRATM